MTNKPPIILPDTAHQLARAIYRALMPTTKARTFSDEKRVAVTDGDEVMVVVSKTSICVITNEKAIVSLFSDSGMTQEEILRRVVEASK